MARALFPHCIITSNDLMSNHIMRRFLLLWISLPHRCSGDVAEVVRYPMALPSRKSAFTCVPRRDRDVTEKIDE